MNYNPQLNFETHYNHWGWNLSLITSVLIILIFRIRDPQTWKQKLGIDFKRKDYFNFIIVITVLLPVSFFLVNHVSKTNGFEFKPKLIFYRDYFPHRNKFLPVLGDYLYYIPETFNEEMLIGAVLLMGLERRFARLDQNIIAIGIALLFSLMHQAMYKYSPIQPGVVLTVQTILVLFFVGIIRNVLILKTRKITYSWALHLSFNLIFFPGFFIKGETQYFASEPERFNIVFGNITMVIITGVLALILVAWLNSGSIINFKQMDSAR